MSTKHTVLLVGGTGRTGRRVLQQLLDRGIGVRAIVRSKEKLPTEVAGNPDLTVIEASLPSLRVEELEPLVRGCDAVISCLGHVISFKGIYGAPRDLVWRATTGLCRAIEAIQPATPIRFILMSSVSVHHPARPEPRRGKLERAFVAVLRGLLPPAKDNQRAADFLCNEIGAAVHGAYHPFVQWTVVRPDTLLDGEISEYLVNEQLVSSLFKPDSTRMANVAHFMCELATNPQTWASWQGKLPVITNLASSGGSSPKGGV